MDRKAGVVRGFFIAPQLAFVYPAYLFSATRAQAPVLSLLQMVVLSLVFGLTTRERRGASQFRWALAALGAWWLAWRVLGLAFSLQPDFDVRM